MKTETYNRSRIEILNWITSFMTANYHKSINGHLITDKNNAFHYADDDKDIPIGTLVKMQSAPFNKYYLAWIVEIKEGNNQFDRQFLLKSIEDGSFCWWSNVSFKYILPELIEENLHWKWTDAQFDFYDKWKRAVKRRNPYITLPIRPRFYDDGSVTLGTRRRFGFTTPAPQKTFTSWKTLKSSEMLAYFDYCESWKEPEQAGVNETT